jgi:hypothetical protein
MDWGFKGGHSPSLDAHIELWCPRDLKLTAISQIQRSGPEDHTWWLLSPLAKTLIIGNEHKPPPVIREQCTGGVWSMKNGTFPITKEMNVVDMEQKITKSLRRDLNA